MEAKRIYSLNLIAYIQFTTGIKPIYKADEITGVYYGVFPVCREVATAINEYRTPELLVNLHGYLNAFQEIKEKLSELKGG